MKFTKNGGTQGAWLDKKELRTGDILKLVSEAKEVEGQNGKQVVAKCRLKGGPEEAKNVSINSPSKNALIEAFGEDSKDWVDKLLTVNIEKMMIGGKRVIALYLVPEGFELKEDDEGYVKVLRQDGTDAPVATDPADMPAVVGNSAPEYPEEDINPDDIPF